MLAVTQLDGFGVAYPNGNDEFTKLLLHMDGSNGSTSFPDSGSIGHAVTAHGNAAVSTSQAAFGQSCSFDGSGDYLTIPSASSLIPGGDYTIDFWAYSANNTGSKGLISKGPIATYCGPYFIRNNAGTVQFFSSSNGTAFDIANAKTMGSITAATWTHIAIARSGNTYYPFVGGVLGTTFTSSATPYTGTDQVVIGAAPDPTDQMMNGYIDELRISIGIARWTATFTPPSGPYT